MLLQGCGGSSSSTPEEPVEPVEYNFSLTSQLTNVCGIASAFTDVELLLQDDTWQTLESYTPDDNGVINFVTESEFINYTLVAKDQKGNEAEGLNVISFYQASSATPSNYQAQFDEQLNNTSCECVTQDVQISHRTFAEQTLVTSSLSYAGWRAIDTKNTLFEGVEVCKSLAGAWPLNSFSISGTDINQKAIAVAKFTDDYSGNGEGLLLLAADEIPDVVDLAMPHQELNTNQIIDSSKHFTAVIAEEDESLLVFATHSYISEAFYQSKASATFVPSDSIFRSSVIKTHQQIISTSATESLAVEATAKQPAFNEPYFDEIKADGSYDYSAVTGFPMAVVNFTFTAYDPTSKLLMPVQWSFYGPEKGLLAISAPLTGYEDIINMGTHIETTNVRLIKTAITNNYHDYIKHYQQESALDMSNDFVRNIEEAELSLKF